MEIQIMPERDPDEHGLLNGDWSGNPKRRTQMVAE